MTEVRDAATAEPGVDTLRVVAGVDPASLSAAGLVDAVIAAERLLSYVNFVQVSLLAELGKPNRCADVTGLVDALVGRAGMGRGVDGEVDAAERAELTAERSVGVAAAEVAAVLDCSPVTARIRIGQAMRMTAVLPGTAAALRSGRVDVGRARMIVDRTAVLSPGLCARVERRVLPLVAGRSKARLESLVDREVVAADPQAAENRRLAAVKGRSVSHRVDKDGMGVITALLPAEAAVMVFTLVDLIAAANKGLDGRSVDQRRADAIADVAEELLTYGCVDLDGLVARAETGAEATAFDGDGDGDGDGDVAERVGADADAAPDADPTSVKPTDTGADSPAGAGADVDRAARLVAAGTRHGRRPHLSVTGAWSTLAGLDDLPGHLDGHGAITADLLRAIAASWGSVTAVGVDPVSGHATAVGGLTYRPGRRICDQVITVSGWCRAAGCRIPAAKCDLDHVEPFDHADPAAGGRTVAAGLLPKCRFHHLLKHHTDWTPHLQPDMTVVWTTATGHTAVSHPREFTAPGEWDRTADHPGPAGGTGRAATMTADPHADGGDGCCGESATDEQGGVLPARGAGVVDLDMPAADDRGAAVPGTSERTVPTGIAGQIVTGPVTGPTIPVIPAGTDYTEPHTELEDPGTIPHPGSVEIHTYRALREDTRRHALRRIGRLAAPTTSADPAGADPTGARDPNRARGATGATGTSDPTAPLTPAQQERQELDRHYRAAQQHPRPPPDPTPPRRLNALDLISDQPLPDEPPF